MIQIEQQLTTGLASIGLDLEPWQEKALLDYLSLIKRWNKTYNLTAIQDTERMLSYHLLDSLAIHKNVRLDTLLDVGSGAGLPGIPLAIAKPGLQVILIDASQKKCAFMQQVAIELRLTNIDVIHARVEQYHCVSKFHQIISRAFTDLNEFVRVTHHLLSSTGVWLAMKGLYPSEEVANLQGARVRQDIELFVPNLLANRRLLVLEAV